MTPQRWQLIDRIFKSAIERSPAERAAFLIEACDNDELRAEVESLISAHEQTGEFLDAPAYEVADVQFAGDAVKILADEESPMLIGKRLGRYQVVSHLGSGGMGDVYLAEDIQLKRKVAVKLLPATLTRNRERLQRFEQEARAASALNHPNIITIHEIGQTEDLNFIVTEFIEGQTLRQLMISTRIELTVALDVATQVASALAAAHTAGIVHRDIKPENVMIRQDGYVKVLDFGIAKLIGAQVPISQDAPTIRQVNTVEGTVVGTAPYMSPEQARGLPVDARTDIWSLGVVIYETIAGRKPFLGDTTQDVLTSVLEKEPPPLTRYTDDLPEGLEWIVSRTLRKEKEARYQTANELLVDLKALKKRIEFIKAMSSQATSDDPLPLGRVPTSAPETEVRPTTPTNSAEYIVTEIKRHRLAFIVGLFVFAAVIVGLGAYFYAGNNEVAIQSIAVLPFENQNHDPDTDYLSDGLTENIINNLTQLPSLRVIPRSSVFHYKGRESDSMTAGRELGVRAVLTGRIMQRGDSLMVSVELVDIRDNKQLWGEQYRRKVSDALPLQQEISRQISDALRLKLTGEEQKQLNKGGTNDAEAYQFYTKGLYYWNKRGASGSLPKAIDQFQQAVQKDSNYALAYVGLANSYSLLEEYTGDQGTQPLQKARAFAERALQIDNSLAEAHSALALTYAGLWLWDDADREFRLSISLNPNYPAAHHWHGELYLWMGRAEEGVAEFKRAQDLDPLSLVISMWLAEIDLRKGDTDAAIKQTNKVLELDRDFPRPHFLLGMVHLRQGRYEEAIAEVQKAVDLSGRSSGYLRSLGYAYGVWGRHTEASATIKDLEQKYARQEAHAQDIAAVYSGLGDKDQAFAWLEKDFKAHSTSLPGITIGFAFDSLRNDPRYADLLRRMGLRP